MTALERHRRSPKRDTGRRDRDQLRASLPKSSSSPRPEHLPVDADVVFKRGYTACVDRRTRLPRWVLEELPVSGDRRDAGLSKRVSRLGQEFREDPDIPALFRASLADYKGSGA